MNAKQGSIHLILNFSREGEIQRKKWDGEIV